MSGEYFSELLKESKGSKKGTELFFHLVESLDDAYETYFDAVKAWRKKEFDKAQKLHDKLIDMELSADKLKDTIYEKIFRKKAYLANITEERYLMVKNADQLIDSMERAVRILCLKEIDHSYFPSEFEEIIEKTEEVIELFIDANKLFFKDYEECSKNCTKIEDLRDEIRDKYYIVLKRAVNDELPRGTQRLLDATTRISIQAEDAADYLKVLMAKHS